MDELLVYWGDEAEPTGLLTRELVFRYSAGASRPISHSLPVEGAREHPGTFFENLLPDGIQRERLARRLGLSDASVFSMLAAIGGDCAGALSLFPPGARRDPTERATSPLSDALLAQFARGNVVAMLLDRGLRLSLAGAQDKLPVVLEPGDTLALPEGSTPSTHILKLPNREYRGLVENEHLMLSLARAVGLSVPAARVWPLPAGGHALLVERFDRRGGARMHQEDFCQATGRPPSAKYEIDGGPSLVEMIEVLTHASVEPLDPLALVRIQAFHVATGNDDGHAKNFALRREPDVRLAPAYDLVCTRAFDHLDRHLGISVGGVRDAGAVGPRAWATFADAANISARAVVRTAHDIARRVEELLPEVRARVVADGVPGRAVARATAAVAKQVKRALRLHDAEPLGPGRRRSS